MYTYPDGVKISEEIFQTLKRFAPGGCMNVLACDQHSSFLKMLKTFFKNAREKGKPLFGEYPEEPGDEDVSKLSRILARTLGGIPSAALFNHLGFLTSGFREIILGEQTMLIGRLEDTVPDRTSDGKGLVAKLAVEPEEIADKVDAFKTLVKLNPLHKESWERNLEWLKDVFERCQKLKKPLFNETLLSIEGMPKSEMAGHLNSAVVKIARDFGPWGHFYKTQVPMLWIKENGRTIPVSTPDGLRESGKIMAKIVARPILLLSAAVDFPQYAAQYSLVADLVSGPMCGRAYFKDPFSDPEIGDWVSLKKAIEGIAIPRMKLIKEIAKNVSRPWWEKIST